MEADTHTSLEIKNAFISSCQELEKRTQSIDSQDKKSIGKTNPILYFSRIKTALKQKAIWKALIEFGPPQWDSPTP